MNSDRKLDSKSAAFSPSLMPSSSTLASPSISSQLSQLVDAKVELLKKLANSGTPEGDLVRTLLMENSRQAMIIHDQDVQIAQLQQNLYATQLMSEQVRQAMTNQALPVRDKLLIEEQQRKEAEAERDKYKREIEGLKNQKAATSKQIKDIVTCPICEEVAVLPKVLGTCGHITCQSCLKQLDHVAFSTLSEKGATARKYLLARRCPLCREEIIGAAFPVLPFKDIIQTLINNGYIDVTKTQSGDSKQTKTAYEKQTPEEKHIAALQTGAYAQSQLAQYSVAGVLSKVTQDQWLHGVYIEFEAYAGRAFFETFATTLHGKAGGVKVFVNAAQLKLFVQLIENKNKPAAPTPDEKSKSHLLIKVASNGCFDILHADSVAVSAPSLGNSTSIPAVNPASMPPPTEMKSAEAKPSEIQSTPPTLPIIKNDSESNDVFVETAGGLGSARIPANPNALILQDPSTRWPNHPEWTVAMLSKAISELTLEPAKSTFIPDQKSAALGSPPVQPAGAAAASAPVQLPALDRNYQESESLSTDTFVKKFAQPSKLMYAMTLVDARLRQLKESAPNAYLKDVAGHISNALRTHFELRAWYHMAEYIASPAIYEARLADPQTKVSFSSDPRINNSELIAIDILIKEGENLTRRLMQRVHWVLAIFEHEGVSFDADFCARVLAADKKWLDDAGAFMKKSMDKAEHLVKSNAQLYSSYRELQKKGVQWPHTAVLRTEVERAGFTFRPMMIKRDRCVCEACGAEVYGWRPWYNPWAFHKLAKHRPEFVEEALAALKGTPGLSNVPTFPVQVAAQTTQNNNAVPQEIKKNEVVAIAPIPLVHAVVATTTPATTLPAAASSTLFATNVQARPENNARILPPSSAPGFG